MKAERESIIEEALMNGGGAAVPRTECVGDDSYTTECAVGPNGPCEGARAENFMRSAQTVQYRLRIRSLGFRYMHSSNTPTPYVSFLVFSLSLMPLSFPNITTAASPQV